MCAQVHEQRVWISVRVRVRVAPVPDRARRLLWDASHSIAYPPAFIARDTLRQQADLLDWNGDEPYAQQQKVAPPFANS